MLPWQELNDSDCIFDNCILIDSFKAHLVKKCGEISFKFESDYCDIELIVM